MRKIPFFAKRKPGHHDCAPVCLQMALAYFDNPMRLHGIHSAAKSLGPTRYTLPWGICIAAANSTLHATFVSKHSEGLINADDVAQATGVTVDYVRRVMREQLAECRALARIALVKYDANTHASLPGSEVARDTGVVIPTLRWNGGAVHNVVLTGINDGTVIYHDPNEASGANRRMSESEFLDRWCDPRTDNDVLIISKDPLRLG